MLTKIVIKNIIIIITTIYYALKKFQILNIDIKSIIKLAVIINIIDSNENVRDLNNIDDTKVIPTFHIKGIKFNDKYFMFEIEVNNLYVILEENNETTEPEPLVNKSTEVTTTNTLIENVVSSETKLPIDTPPLNVQPTSNETVIEDTTLSEHKLNVDNLEETKINFDKNDFLKIYEIINNRIKIDIQKHLRNMFIQKTIKNEVDLNEMIDDEEDN
jgi:hypothetical protein